MDVESFAMTGENITKRSSITRHQHLAELPSLRRYENRNQEVLSDAILRIRSKRY